MKLTDLENGMQVETRSGIRFLVLVNMLTVYDGVQPIQFLNEYDFEYGHFYTEDMYHKERKTLDIVRVFRQGQPIFRLKDCLKPYSSDFLIWERKKEKEVEKMQLSDLRNYMIVEMREGRRFLVLLDVPTIKNDKEKILFVSSGLTVVGTDYCHNMCHPTKKNYDIVAVYTPEFIDSLPTASFLNQRHNLLWEREEEKKKETYLERQERCKLKVGDFVKITRTITAEERTLIGWTACWVPEMTETVGYIGKIVEIDHTANSGISIHIKDNMIDFWYPYNVLERV